MKHSLKMWGTSGREPILAFAAMEGKISSSSKQAAGPYRYHRKMLAYFYWFAQELGTSGTGITEVVHF